MLSTTFPVCAPVRLAAVRLVYLYPFPQVDSRDGKAVTSKTTSCENRDRSRIPSPPSSSTPVTVNWLLLCSIVTPP